MLNRIVNLILKFLLPNIFLIEEILYIEGVSPEVGQWPYSAIWALSIYAICKRAILSTAPFTD